jgi:hypothetical protein
MSWPSFGCTVLGAGVGALVPRSGDEQTTRLEAVPPGSDVSLVYYRPVDERGGGLIRVDGTYRGIENDRAIVERGDRTYGIPLSRIQETRARPLMGNHANEGALIGAALDVSVILLIVYLNAREMGGDRY